MKPRAAAKKIAWVSVASLVLGAGVAVAQELSMSLTPERASMAQAVMVRNVLNNVTAPSTLTAKMTLPAAPIAANVANAPGDVPVVGRVVWVKGDFKASLKQGAELQKARALSQASSIYLHDTLTTGPDSQAQIVFTDDTLMTFKPQSEFYINTYQFTPDKKEKSVGRYIMNLVKGGFRTITGLIAKSNPSDYQVNTPVATIGVRGTDYTVIIRESGVYIGRNKGTPCIKSDVKNLCLDSEKKYATVASANSAPVYLNQPPAFMVEPIPVTPVNIQTMSTPGAQPNVSGGTSGSNFCIQ